MDHKKERIIVIVLVLFCANTRVWASGYEFFGTGIRALSMGGAFMAKADDATATYWNPAGLGQLKGKGIDIDLENDMVNYYDNNSMRNVSLAELSTIRNDVFIRHLPTEPGRFGEAKPNIFFAMADLAGYYHWKGYTLGGAFYVPNGQFIDWKDTIVNSAGEIIRAKFFNRFLLSVTNLSIAREVFPGVLLGGGMNLIIGSFRLDVNKYLVGSKVQDYAFGVDSKGLGSGLEGVFGLLLKPTDWLSMGAVYRTGANINVNGHLHILQTPVPAIPAGFDAASDYKQDFPLPPTWGIGIALKPIPKLTVTFDAQGTDWTVMKTEIDYHNQRVGFPLPNINQKLYWNISWRYRAGLEYRLNDRWAFMAGYMYDENAIPDNASSLTTTSGLILNVITLGARYGWGRWELSLHANTHRYYERVEHRSIGGTDYMFGLGIAYHF